MSAHTTNMADLSEVESSTIRLIRNRCIPILTLAFIVSFIDRVNVGFAAITANKDLGLSPQMYGFGAGLLFVGYAVFQTPSNLAMERFGARKWIALLMIVWGIVAGRMVLVVGPLSFYLVRFLLGAVEAGFFPGVILYLTYWFPRRHRARYISLFAVVIPLSSVIGSPISGLVLGMNGLLGVKGWQWLYIIESMPPVILGILTLIFLTGRPAQAGWLSQTQRQWLQSTLEQERLEHQETEHIAAWKMLGDARVLVLAAIFFLVSVPSYGLSLWLPQIVKSFGLTNIATGLVAAIPFLVGCFTMVWWGNRSDRRQERAWHTAIAAFVAFAGLAVGAYMSSPLVPLLSVCVAAGFNASLGPNAIRLTNRYICFSRRQIDQGEALRCPVPNPAASSLSRCPRPRSERHTEVAGTSHYPPSVWSWSLNQASACSKCRGSKSGQYSSLT
jgi:ACS family tartrate transporter-like MFS transporter